MQEDSTSQQLSWKSLLGSNKDDIYNSKEDLYDYSNSTSEYSSETDDVIDTSNKAKPSLHR